MSLFLSFPDKNTRDIAEKCRVIWNIQFNDLFILPSCEHARAAVKHSNPQHYKGLKILLYSD